MTEKPAQETNTKATEVGSCREPLVELEKEVRAVLDVFGLLSNLTYSEVIVKLF